MKKINPIEHRETNPVQQTIEAINFFLSIDIEETEPFEYGGRVTTVKREISNAQEAQKCFLTWGE